MDLTETLMSNTIKDSDKLAFIFEAIEVSHINVERL